MLSAPTSADRIHVKGVDQVFPAAGGGETVAIKDATFDLIKGQITVFLGPSGCGKTTMLRMLGGLDVPTAGTIERGFPVGKGAPIGFVFQDATLMPWRTTAGNVELSLEMSGYPRAKRADRVRELLELVKLEGTEKRHPYQLSGGMRQRVAIARALAHDPDLLLMDEPFAALDAQTRDEMNQELQRIWGLTRKTIVFVTHSVAEAVTLADRIVMFGTNPGHVHSVTDISFPRPRDEQTASLPEFTAIVAELRAQLRDVQQQNTRQRLESDDR